MNKLSLLLWIQVIRTTVTLDYETRCPAAGEWRFRGRKLNCGSTQYVCLLHTSWNIYHENCDGLDYSSTGSKLIFEPFFNKALCSNNRYQPFPFSTDGSSKCVYQKSFCSEKGQYVFHKGSLTSDTTCGCDLSSGYEFVLRPKNICFCIPSEEDCSCHRLLCYDKDEQCPHDNDVVKNRRLTDDTLITAVIEIRSNDANYTFSDLKSHKNIRIQCIYISTLLLAGMILVLSSLYAPRNLKIVEYTFHSITVEWYIKDLENRLQYMVSLTNIKTNKKKVKKVKNLTTKTAEPVGRNRYTIGNLDPETVYEVKVCSVLYHIKTRHTEYKTQKTKSIEFPEAITGLEKRYKDSFINVMQREQSEKRYSVTVMIMGMKSAGKTSLLGKLLQKGIEDVTSTDGVHINETGCKIKIEDGKWKIKKELTANTTDRILKAINERTNKEADNPTVTLSDVLSNVYTETLYSNTNTHRYATCRFWDFSGKRDISVSQQAFLRSSAIYLVVAKIEDEIGEIGIQPNVTYLRDAKGHVDFLFNTIHSYGTVNQPESEFYNQFLNPPVFMVITGTDKFRETEDRKTALQKRMQEIHTQLLQVIGRQRKIHHLRNVFFLSNTTTGDEEFEKLRQAISRTAMNMNHWGERCPLKWILLEKTIEIYRVLGNNFMNFSDMKELVNNPSVEIQDINELVLFLHFQHAKGNILFFDDMQDFIILNPNYLIDAVRCLVLNAKIDNYGITESSITKLFNSVLKGRYSNQVEMLVKVLEKIDFLIKIDIIIPEYIIPSNVPSVLFETISDKYNILHCKRSSWLCLKFQSLPPTFFYHLCAMFINKYYESNKDEHKNRLFRGMFICDIDQLSCDKLLVTSVADTIAVQHLSFSTEEKDAGNICSNIRKFLIATTEGIQKRYKLKFVYEIHFKCSMDNRFEDTHSLANLKRCQEYFCIQHRTGHTSKQIYSPWMLNENEML